MLLVVNGRGNAMIASRSTVSCYHLLPHRIQFLLLILILVNTGGTRNIGSHSVREDFHQNMHLIKQEAL
jgi:hypothetical protein